MEVTVTVTYHTAMDDNVWASKLEPSDIAMFGRLPKAPGEVSVVSIKNVSVDSSAKSLKINLKDASLLHHGTGGSCVFVHVGTTAQNEQHQTRVSATGLNPTTEQKFQQAPINQRSGDSAFLQACKGEGLPIEMVKLISDFLNAVRVFSNDELVEGQSRKWVSKPRNFVAITIQNRNKQFCIHVKKSPVLKSLESTLDIRDDRPGYVRFWLQGENQLEAAIAAARGSYF